MRQADLGWSVYIRIGKRDRDMGAKMKRIPQSEFIYFTYLQEFVYMLYCETLESRSDSFGAASSDKATMGLVVPAPLQKHRVMMAAVQTCNTRCEGWKNTQP